MPVITRSHSTKVKNERDVCAHCNKDLDREQSWNKASRCCSKECSNNLKRPCGYNKCKKQFTRSSGYNFYCSMPCFNKDNPNNTIYCPMFA